MSVKPLADHYYDLTGTFRSQPAEQSLTMLQPLLPKLGVTRVANITGLDTIGIPVVTCIRPMARHLSVSQGKGASVELAKISAIMEAAESYHMEHPPATALSGSYSALKDDHMVIDPTQFEHGTLIHHRLHEQVFDWIQAQYLTTHEDAYVPKTLANLDSTTLHPGYAFFNVTTNGIAAGNTRDEAICHALYEIIERDSLYRWGKLSVEQRLKTQLALNDIDGYNGELLEHFQRSATPIKVWDITSSLGIPSFHCAISDQEGMRNLGIFTGTGTHLAKSVALSRALTEAAQARLTLISGNRDDILPKYYQLRGPQQSLQALNHVAEGKRRWVDCKDHDLSFSFERNWQDLVQRLSDQGSPDVFLIEHTKPEVGIPVTQLLVPGMRFRAARM